MPCCAVLSCARPQQSGGEDALGHVGDGLQPGVSGALMAPGGHELQAVPSHLLASHAGAGAGAGPAAAEPAPALFYMDATQGGAADPLGVWRQRLSQPAYVALCQCTAMRLQGYCQSESVDWRMAFPASSASLC